MLTDCITISFLTAGIYIAFNWPGMIFSDVASHLLRIFPDYITKPLFNCPYCMASAWTIIYCAFTHDITWLILIKIPVVCGITAMMVDISNRLRRN